MTNHETPDPTATNQAAEAEAPLSPDYEHPECGFHWHGRDDMDIPMRDGQPVCPRCELRRVEKLLAHRERRCEELRAESKRRGKVKLEYAEKNRALERQIDEVRGQLGAEILRAGQAEAELAAAVSVPPPATRADDRATLRDRIRRVLCEAKGEGFMWDTDMLEPDEYGDVADVVLAVLPEPVDRGAEERVRAVLESEAVVGRSALEYRGLIVSALMADEAQQPAPGPCVAGEQRPECIASMSGNCLREGQSETACDTEAGECVHGGRPAGEEQQNETPEAEAPTTTVWTFKGCYDSDNDKWHGIGGTYSDHDEALDAFQHRAGNDSDHVKHSKFRLVRATTTYTVEAEIEAAAKAPE